jgi:hypothetical protein
MEIFPFISSSENLIELRDLFLTSLGPQGNLKEITFNQKARIYKKNKKI